MYLSASAIGAVIGNGSASPVGAEILTGLDEGARLFDDAGQPGNDGTHRNRLGEKLGDTGIAGLGYPFEG